MPRRPLHDTLADAIYDVVHGGPLTPKALAARVGRTHGYLLDAANPHDELKLQVATVVPLTNAQGNYAIVRWLAHHCGGMFVRRPHATVTDLDVVRAHAEVLREVGEDAEAIGTALASDGRIDPAEAADILRDLDETMAQLAALREVIARRADAVAPFAVRGGAR